jgi:hypothetical protein
VRYVSHAQDFYARIQTRFGAAVQDTAAVADQLPGSPRDLRAVQHGPLRWRVGSSADHARAQELGAYIVPRQRRALKFASGAFSKRARLPAKRYLRRAAATFGSHLARRLRA